MENNITYKRVKINWWIIILFGATHLLIILNLFLDGNIGSGTIAVSIIFIFLYITLGRFKLIINDDFVVFRSDIFSLLNTPIKKIKNISTIQLDYFSMASNNRRQDIVKKYYFDFTAKQAIIIELKNGKIYWFSIKDAEKVKEEIEKRMITTYKPQ